MAVSGTRDASQLTAFNESANNGGTATLIIPEEANKIEEIDAELPDGAKSPIDGQDLERSELISEHSFANKMFIQ